MIRRLLVRLLLGLLVLVLLVALWFYVQTHRRPALEGYAWMEPAPAAAPIQVRFAGVATLLFQTRRGASIYQRQSNRVLDEVMRRGRLRFGDAVIFPRRDAAKQVIREVRKGSGFFNLPDMDFGRKDSAFVPFFGVPAATLLAPSRMARSLGMVVQPVLAELLPGGQGYKVHYLPPWDDFPTDDALADTARLNRWIEERIRERPAQYLWVHKRFKTRPVGEPSLYR